MGVFQLEQTNNIWLMAGDENNFKGVQEFLTHSDPNMQDDNGFSLLHAAVQYENLDIIQLLNSYQCNLNIADSDGDTPLHHAETLNCVKLLIELGSNPLLRNHMGQLPIESAYRSGYNEIVEELKKFTPDFNFEGIGKDQEEDIDIDGLENNSIDIYEYARMAGIDLNFVGVDDDNESDR